MWGRLLTAGECPWRSFCRTCWLQREHPFFSWEAEERGKTTALLRAAYLQRRNISGMEPAAVYISLYGCEEEDASYIKDRLLESLRFKPGTDTMETARHELVRLLSSPIHTRFGERPKLLLLLDGLNEASGDTRLLVKEIGGA